MIIILPLHYQVLPPPVLLILYSMVVRSSTRPMITIVKAVQRRLLSNIMGATAVSLRYSSIVKSINVLILMAVLLSSLVHKVTSPLPLLVEVIFTLQVLWKLERSTPLKLERRTHWMNMDNSTRFPLIWPSPSSSLKEELLSRQLI